MSDVDKMNIETFETAMARWGADLAAWPEDARRAAEALLEGSAETRALRAEMIEMEATLADAREAGTTPDRLMARVLADAASVSAARAPVTESAPKASVGWRFRDALRGLSPFWRAAGTCAASALVGIFVGYMSPAPIAEAATSMASFELISGDDGEDDENFELALNDLEPF